VILPEHIHNFFGFRCFSEAREASQINVPVTSARRALRVSSPSVDMMMSLTSELLT